MPGNFKTLPKMSKTLFNMIMETKQVFPGNVRRESPAAHIIEHVIQMDAKITGCQILTLSADF